MSMEFSRQEYWSGLSFPSPGALPGRSQRSNPDVPMQADCLLSELPGKSLISAIKNLMRPHWLTLVFFPNQKEESRKYWCILGWEVSGTLVHHPHMSICNLTNAQVSWLQGCCSLPWDMWLTGSEDGLVGRFGSFKLPLTTLLPANSDTGLMKYVRTTRFSLLEFQNRYDSLGK